MRIALFPGTFDPVTFGHIDIIERSLPLFDKLYIGIGVNANQVPTDFPEELRSHATSLAIVRGGPVDRSALAIDLLKNLDQSYRKNFCGASANAIRTKSAYQQP